MHGSHDDEFKAKRNRRPAHHATWYKPPIKRKRHVSYNRHVPADGDLFSAMRRWSLDDRRRLRRRKHGWK